MPRRARARASASFPRTSRRAQDRERTCSMSLSKSWCALLLRRAGDDLGEHRVVPQPAILEAQDAIRARCTERVADDVRESGHRLGLRDQVIARVVQAEPVIDVSAGDTNLHRLADWHRVRADGPCPLL